MWSSRGVLTSLVVIFLPVSPAFADVAQSQAWFAGLSASQQMVVQADLVLTGDYTALVDGQFGPATFRAIQSFQLSIEEPPSGVLSASALQELESKGTQTYNDLGFEEVHDTSAHLDVYVPTSLLTEKTEAPHGRTYAAPNGDFDLATDYVEGGGEAFVDLFNARTSSDGTEVTYSVNTGSVFSVAGLVGGRRFYTRYYRDGEDAVGFTMAWSASENDRGQVIATFIASLSAPIDAGDSTVVSPTVDQSASSDDVAEIPLKQAGGTLEVPVVVNGAITLDFMIDSGAADVNVPADVVLTLMRAGTIGTDDFLGTQTYVLADGTTVPSQTFKLHSLKVGTIEMHDVLASVGSASGTLLLGQSFLSHFQTWSIDNKRQLLVLH